jgi:hypothetical protein
MKGNKKNLDHFSSTLKPVKWSWKNKRNKISSWIFGGSLLLLERHLAFTYLIRGVVITSFYYPKYWLNFIFAYHLTQALLEQAGLQITRSGWVIGHVTKGIFDEAVRPHRVILTEVYLFFVLF